MSSRILEVGRLSLTQASTLLFHEGKWFDMKKDAVIEISVDLDPKDYRQYSSELRQELEPLGYIIGEDFTRYNYIKDKWGDWFKEQISNAYEDGFYLTFEDRLEMDMFAWRDDLLQVPRGIVVKFLDSGPEKTLATLFKLTWGGR